MRRLLYCVVVLSACSSGGGEPDAAVADLSVRDAAAADLAVFTDGSMVRDLAVADASGCLASTPPTQLYEDACPAGSGGSICFIDHPPTDFF